MSAAELWMLDAVCRDVDPNVFFPGNSQIDLEVAKRVCRGCPVRSECLEFALRNNYDHGVWGGNSERERRRIRRARRIRGQTG